MKTKPNAAAGAALDFLISHAQNNKGTISAVAARLTERTGQPIYRQYVSLWLHPNPKRRVDPSFGMGLLLVAEGCAMMGRDSFELLSALPKEQKRVPKKKTARKARKRKTARIRRKARKK